jgi:hypothetical protein
LGVNGGFGQVLNTRWASRMEIGLGPGAKSDVGFAEGGSVEGIKTGGQLNRQRRLDGLLMSHRHMLLVDLYLCISKVGRVN